MIMRAAVLFKACLSLILVAALGGCFYGPTAPKDIDPANMEGYGIVIVSCSTGTDPQSNYYCTPHVSFFYGSDQATRRKNGQFTSSGWLNTIPPFKSETGDLGENLAGTVYALHLKPGDYMFYGVSLTSNGHWTGMIRPPRCFRVTAGTVTYIGNLHFSTLLYDYYGCKKAGYRVEVKDMQTRDLPIILAKHPNLKADQIQISLMEGEQVGFNVMRGSRGAMDDGFDMSSYHMMCEEQRRNTGSKPSP